MHWSKPIILFLVAFYITSSYAQSGQKIEIVQATELVFQEKTGIKAQRLIGDVIFKHKDALMYCDSAYLYNDENKLEAYGAVRINQGDTLNLYGDELTYNGDEQIAIVKGEEVKLINSNFILTTTELEYDRTVNRADYYRGAVIESKNDSNVLISKIGHFYANQALFFFKDSVQLTNPNFVMNSDTLKYFSNTEFVNFLGPTTITGDSNLIYCETGWYDTKKDQSQYYDNAYILTDGRKLEGDTLFYDRILGYGEANQNIIITDTANKILIGGEHGEIYEKIDSAIIYDRPLLTQILDGDSLFMHADTFKVYKDSLLNQFMIAYHDVKIFKSDLQGKADSIVYALTDSTIQLHHEPVLWSDSNQLTAVQINIRTKENKIHSIFLDKDAFIISEVDSVKYNQIKGKEMTGYFKGSKLSTIKVRGNGETTYFGQDDQDKFIGVNVAESSDIDITLADNKINTIAFINQPNATMYPMGEKDPVTELRYKGFKWLIEFRPMKKEDIFD